MALSVSNLGGMMGSQSGGGKGGNFLSQIAEAEKDAWTKYINSTNQQMQASLPTQAQPVAQPSVQVQQPAAAPVADAQAQQPAAQPAAPTAPATSSDGDSPVDPAFIDYKNTAAEANEAKKKQKDQQSKSAEATTL